MQIDPDLETKEEMTLVSPVDTVMNEACFFALVYTA